VSAINDGGAAFPVPNDAYNNGMEGMSLRDWFAGQALVGELASSSTQEAVMATAQAAFASGRSAVQQVAFNCYEMADAMLAARERKEDA